MIDNTRRSLLKALGAAGIAGSAGCTGWFGGEDDEGSGGSAVPTAPSSVTGWPMGLYDWRNSNSADVAVSEAKPTEAWRRGGPTYRVTVDGDDVFGAKIGGAVFATDRESGERRWTVDVQEPVRRSPEVDDRTVAAVAGSTLVALERETGEERWRSGDLVERRSDAVLVDGVVYAQTEESLVAFDALTGDRLWSRERYPSRGTLRVRDGTVYLPETAAFDADTGEKLWEADVGPPTGVTVPFSVGDERVYVVRDETLYALDAASGDTEWTVGINDEGTFERPIAADGEVYLLFQPEIDDFLLSLDASDGSERFRAEIGRYVTTQPVILDDAVALGTRSEDTTIEGESAVALYDRESGEERTVLDGTLPVYDVAGADGSLYAATAGGAVTALDRAADEVEWTDETIGRPYSSPAVVGDGVYQPVNDGTLYRFARSDGSVDWTVEVEDARFSTPAVLDGTVFASDLRGTVYGIDAESGEELWTASVKQGLHERQNYTSLFQGYGSYPDQYSQVLRPSPTAVDGAVFVAEGDVRAFDPESGEELWQFDREGEESFREGEFDRTPAFADGTVFVSQPEEGVYALDAATGTVEWEESLDVTSAPVCADDYVVVTGETITSDAEDRWTKAFDARDGTEEWSADVGGEGVLAATDEAVVVVGGDDGNVYELALDDGSERRKLEDGYPDGAPTLVDGHWLIPGSAGLDAVDENGEAVWKLARGQDGSPPVVREGEIFRATDHGLTKHSFEPPE